MIRALVLTGPGQLEEREFSRPHIGSEDALVRVEACGLCGNDHEQFSGLLPITEPFIQGHEIVGRVEEAGSGARDRGLTPGTRVAVEVFRSCGECSECLIGRYPLCRVHGLRDSYGNTPLSVGSGLWGGYSTHVMLDKDAIAIPVPDDLDSEYATLFNPLGAGIKWAVDIPALREGETVAVLGPGLRGLCAVAAVKAHGASLAMLTGAGAGDAARLELGKRLGADLVVDVTKEDPKARFKEAVGGLADVVVDVTAGAPQAFAQALDLVRPGGRVVVAGTRGTRTLPEFNPDRIVFKMITILGARGVDRASYERAFDMLRSDERFREIPRATSPATVDGMSRLLDEMAHGANRPLHGVCLP
jgi:alcohol dehydrogenase